MFDFLFGFTSSSHMVQQPYFTCEPLYKLWIKDKSPECNIWGYLAFKEEIQHATRLEF